MLDFAKLFRKSLKKLINTCSPKDSNKNTKNINSKNSSQSQNNRKSDADNISKSNCKMSENNNDLPIEKMSEDEGIFDKPKFVKPSKNQTHVQKNSEFEDRFKDLYKQRFNKTFKLDKVKINRSESKDDISVNYSENLRNSRFA